MKHDKLETFTKGWFIGNFAPTLYQTNDVEVAVKHYQAGDYEQEHHHKIATEVTVIVSGEVKMNEQTFVTGDIIVIEPFESTDFLVVKDTTTTVVKIPGANDDKYLGKAHD